MTSTSSSRPQPPSVHPLAARLRATVREVPDFPTAGISFKDITPVLADPLLLRECVDAMASGFDDGRVDRVVAVESRGFLFGVPVALALGARFSPVRKPGKLPWETIRESYALEYRDDVIEMHRDAIVPGERVLIVDDVLATGGTAEATARLVRALGGQTIGIAVLIELGFLSGRERLAPIPVEALLVY